MSNTTERENPLSYIRSSSIQSVGTPLDLFAVLDNMYNFHWDLAADPVLAKCVNYFGVKPHFEEYLDRLISEHKEKYGNKKKAQLNEAINAYLAKFSQNALLLDWSSICGTSQWLFCNPTYYNLRDWTEKFLEQHHRGCRIVALIPASIGSGWYCDNIDNQIGVSVEVLKGRLKFPGYDGSAGGYHMLVIYDGRGVADFSPPEIFDWKWVAKTLMVDQ